MYLFLLTGNKISLRKNSPPPTYTPPGTILVREGFDPLERSRGFGSAIDSFKFGNAFNQKG